MAAWTYMELLLVEFIQNEPADRGVGGRGTVEIHRAVSYETAWPELSVRDHRAVMSALYEKDVTLGGEISRVLHKPEI